MILKKPKEVEFKKTKEEKRRDKKNAKIASELNQDIPEIPKEFDLYGGFAINDQESRAITADKVGCNNTLLVTRKKDTLKTVPIDPTFYPFDKIKNKNAIRSV